MVCNCIPAKKDCIAAIIVNPHTISVGKFGTSPVFKYSLITGIKKHIDIIVNIAAIIEASSECVSR